MTRVTASDQIIFLLRAKLEHAAALKKRDKAGRVRSTPRDPPSVERIRALAQVDTLSDEDFGRSMIQGLLVEAFGEAMVNDPKFQQIVTRVAMLLSDDDEGRELLAAARRDLIS